MAENALPRYTNVLFKCCCTFPAAPLRFEAFIREVFLFRGHLVSFWFINVSLGAIGTMEESFVGLFYCEYSILDRPFLTKRRLHEVHLPGL